MVLIGRQTRATACRGVATGHNIAAPPRVGQLRGHAAPVPSREASVSGVRGLSAQRPQRPGLGKGAPVSPLPADRVPELQTPDHFLVPHVAPNDQVYQRRGTLDDDAGDGDDAATMSEADNTTVSAGDTTKAESSKRPVYHVRNDDQAALQRMTVRWRIVIVVMAALMATVTAVTALSLTYYMHSLSTIEACVWCPL